MTYLFSDGFDGHGALADRWDTVDVNSIIIADVGKYGTGTNALRFTNSGDFVKTTFSSSTPTNTRGTATNPIHVSMFVKMAGAPATVNRALLALLSSVDGLDGFAIAAQLSTGNISIAHWRAGAVIETTSIPLNNVISKSISDDVWHHIEIKYVADNASGIIKIWVDGTLELDISGDTLISGSITGDGIDHVLLGNGNNTSDTFIDDILIWDEEGTSMNTVGQLGIHRIETTIPDGDGNSTQLTATGAGTTNADRVDEVDADDDTTYVESSTATHKDLYTYSAMTGTPATVEGVVVHTRGTNPDNGAISFKQVTRSNVTEADGATFQLSAAGVYAQHEEFVALDPDGDIAWTKAKIDLAEFGVEVV